MDAQERSKLISKGCPKRKAKPGPAVHGRSVPRGGATKWDEKVSHNARRIAVTK